MSGRGAELAVLLEAFGRAQAGDAQVVVVTGEAGIGKTRLVREFAERVPGETVVALGYAVPLSGDAIPYGVVADLLRSLVLAVEGEVLAILGERTRDLAPLVPRLGQGSSEPVDRIALMTATQDLMADLGLDHTIVLVVEDLHWADPSSLDLMRFWARTSVTGRVMLVLTSRPRPDLPDALVELRRLPLACGVEIQPLDRREIVEQIAALTSASDDGELLASVVDDIVRLSEGYPLFVEELVSSGGSLPESLGLDLTRRLNVLDRPHVEALRLASLDPAEIESDLLAGVGQLSVADVERAVDAATAAGLVEPVGHRFRFRHELLRQAVAASLMPRERAQMHGRWADELEGRGGAANLVRAADHLEAAGVTRRAFLSRIKAADALWDIDASAETRGQWRRALDLIDSDPSVATPDEHDLALGCFHQMSMTWEEASVVFGRESDAPPVPQLRRDLLALMRYVVSEFRDGRRICRPPWENSSRSENVSDSPSRRGSASR